MTFMELARKAIKLHPSNKHFQRQWIKAVKYLDKNWIMHPNYEFNVKHRLYGNGKDH
jgi:hypothetical protein